MIDLAPYVDLTVSKLFAGKPASKSALEYRIGRKGSLKICRKTGRFFDFETGDSGSLLALIAREQGFSIANAFGWLGLDDCPIPARAVHRPVAPREPDSDRQAKAAAAMRIWAEAVPLPGTLGERYLKSRKLVGPWPEVLRFHPRCAFGAVRLPCLIALMINPTTGEPTGVQRVALTKDGKKIDRRMLGPAGIVQLSDADDVSMGLGIAEGIETALSVIQSGWKPVWAALSAGEIAKFPALQGIESLTIFADHDDAGMTAAASCADRWRSAGRECRIIAPPTPGHDFNDFLRGADNV